MIINIKSNFQKLLFTLALLPVCLILSMHTGAQSTSLKLHAGWQMRETGTSKWYTAKVPGTVHTDLMKHKVIADPYYRDNENKVQWVSAKDWEYRTSFNLKTTMLREKRVYIEFKGLDTYADVFLNGILLLKADNMFRTWQVEIKEKAKAGTNELRIVFYSPDRLADSIAKTALPLVRPSENNRHYVRKAQYHYGWDWGPKLTTSGIWRDVTLVATSNLDTEPIPSHPLASQVKLVQEPDSIGQSFYFTVNGVPTYMKGANWIPGDMFLPRMTRQRYRELLVAAKEANFNMLRVWGGGVYEDDYFYELCDSLGIHIWQDFMFAGAMYPAEPAFLESVKREAVDNITRLRKFKCIVLWCGNNEIDEAWHNWGWNKGISATDSAKLWNDYVKLFHETLPALVKTHDPNRAYITTSPLFGWGRAKSLTHADSHYWGLWHGMEPLSVMQKKVPRFSSEFGMQAMPEMATIRQFSLPQDWDTSSVVMKVHQKHRTGYQNLAGYLKMENMAPKSFEAFVEATQELQSRALETAITAQMQSNGRCMGTLFWQFNDCWPVTSWSVIDYYGRKKKAFYTVKRLFGQTANNR